MKANLYHIIFWDLNHLIVAQYDSEFLGIIDIDNKKIKNLFEFQDKIACVKKISLNQKEEFLLTSGENTGDIFIHFLSVVTTLSSKTDI